MKKLAVIAVAVLTLAGCKTQTVETTRAYQMPQGMQDCRVFELESASEKDLYVVRCPMSSTTAVWKENQGKSTRDYSSTTLEM